MIKEIEDIRRAVLRDKRTAPQKAESIGVYPNTIYNLIEGRYPNIDKLDAIADYYGLPCIRQKLHDAIKKINIYAETSGKSYNKIINEMGRYDYKIRNVIKNYKYDKICAKTIDTIICYSIIIEKQQYENN